MDHAQGMATAWSSGGICEAFRFTYHFKVATVHDLISRLSGAGAGPVSSADLRKALGVSPATLSRLVKAAGSEVVRLGQTRAVAYARTRTIEGMGRRLPVFRVAEDGTPNRTGELLLLWERSTWLAEAGAPGGWFTGLPPQLADMAPEGYLGHGFARRHPELRLPPRLSDWSDDDRLRALAFRGEDAVGNVLLGSESLARFAAWEQAPVGPADYPALALRSAVDDRGSSAGGERPKFGAFSGGRHVLVKFATPDEAPLARRWRDLLWCEARALAVIAQSGQAKAVEAVVHDVDGWRFLETVRFDRAGTRGRRAVLSLEAIANEYLGDRESWTAAAALLSGGASAPYSLPAPEASRLRWLDAFGQLIGNTDRHFGNVAFLVEGGGALRVAPAYDMLPMLLAPSADLLVERPYTPAPPSGANLAEWKAAAPWAARYWRELAADPRLDPTVRQVAEAAGQALDRIGRAVSPGEWDRLRAAAGYAPGVDLTGSERGHHG
jgi:HipA-like protein